MILAERPTIEGDKKQVQATQSRLRTSQKITSEVTWHETQRSLLDAFYERLVMAILSCEAFTCKSLVKSVSLLTTNQEQQYNGSYSA